MLDTSCCACASSSATASWRMRDSARLVASRTRIEAAATRCPSASIRGAKPSRRRATLACSTAWMPRPLAAYYFGDDGHEQKSVETRTTSGGICINDVVMHVSQEDLPFGGVGPSGMGSYHGKEGFRTFSHAKSIYRQTGLNFGKLSGMLPPYGKATEKTIKMQLKK